MVGAVVAALVVGFAAGLLAFRVKSRWCPECGATTGAARGRNQMPAPRPMDHRRTADVWTR
jgi:hypothetical protein